MGVDENQTSVSTILAYPNPSTGAILFIGTAAEPMPVLMSVYDMQGKRVHRETTVVTSPGEFRMAWDGQLPDGGSSSGQYSAVFTFGTQQVRVPFVLIR